MLTRPETRNRAYAGTVVAEDQAEAAAVATGRHTRPAAITELAREAARPSSPLVHHLEAVKTLGSATFNCTDQTGTLIRSEMALDEVGASGFAG
ncbi:hypothetical protein [Nonomuraea basaltis]|uniref:P-type ATPase n=1 Tax=Nonomuraea basaltis TaxID=2495887 RepID=UPI00110C44C5|nr:hypothetical protein [Nonomuraea basaltis]TMR90701.1 hypothetical protein EJK15_54005 [Nonomuraea basaltis]